MVSQNAFEFFDSVPKRFDKIKPGTAPIDLIYTAGQKGQNPLDEPTYVKTHCCIAVGLGWLYGVQSDGAGGVCGTAVFNPEHRPQFMDTNYKQYNHELHLASVAKWNPKYATVRDIMTKEQCDAVGAEYYPFEQIMEWAEELSEHTDNVIVIPKYDCIDRIPEKFMLGFSVPTSHGGTPLPTEMFKGWRVHLLGGSWKNQLKYIEALTDEVVSIDNNHILRIARHGRYIKSDGNGAQLSDIAPKTQPFYTALSLSLGNIKYQVNQMYGVENESAQIPLRSNGCNCHDANHFQCECCKAH